ncbi:1-acylglycerol-3-phosphate O-acyltransferase [Neisseria sp.]|uniref:1-acylglycerol-3-phosphate O-acyltransferase n=1 Tax=Neisseria sp. TaxID=192066 RepID=UPI0035A0108F
MSAPKAPFLTRLRRLARLARWLFQTGRNLSSIDRDNPVQRNRILVQLGAGALQALDIELKVEGRRTGSEKGLLVVGNHVSWLDIFAMSTVFPSSFIAKQEIGSWPVLGRMGKNAGTVFINRNSRRDVEPINLAVGEALKSGKNVSFFPEAKTSPGLDILPFKAALFQSAIDTDSPVQAVALRYYDALGRRSVVPSYADVSLPVSLWRIVSMEKLTIRIDCAEPFRPSEFPDKDRFGIKDIAETYIKGVVTEDAV